MVSFGESDILVSSFTVGKVRVQNIFHDPAIYPRLGLYIGWTLLERPDSLAAPDVPLTDYELRELIGELSLKEREDVIGPVLWTGQRTGIRSTHDGWERQLKMTCDLDPWRIEKIERIRDGKEPKLWLNLWPTLVARGVGLDTRMLSPIPISVPRDTWIDFLTKARGCFYDILEFKYAGEEAIRFRKAFEHLKSARRSVDRGEYNLAVSMCRKAIETVYHEIPNDALKEQLVAKTDKKRAGEYMSFIARIKQLAGCAVHDFKPASEYSRIEALFVIQSTESIIALLNGLTELPKE